MSESTWKGALAEYKIITRAIALGIPVLEPVLEGPRYDGRACMHLRLAPARNNQELLVHWAADYRLGAIAQLGERSAGSRKVGGSNPPSSTSEGPP
jgi:hypothetical protein